MAFLLELYGQTYLGGSIGAGIQKKTWALITLMVYAVPVHFLYSKHQHAPLFYHIYMLLAFSTVLMTYFGVNYFLGGMHSYA